MVGSVPSEDEEYSGEGVERKEKTEGSKDGG